MTGKPQSIIGNLFQNSIFKNRVFVTILIISVFTYNSMIMMMISLPKFAYELGASSQEIGLLSGIFALCAFLMRPLAGQLVDRGNKPVMLRIIFAVLLISAIGFTQSTEYWMLILFRGLSGLAWGIGSTLFMTIATGCFSSDDMTTGIGYYSMGLTLALTVAPMITFPIADKFGYNNLYYVNVVSILIGFALSFLLKIEYIRPEEPAPAFHLKNMLHPPALLPTVVTMANTISRAAITAFLVIFAGTLGIENVAVYFTIRAVILFVFRPVVGKLSNRFGALKLLVMSEALAIVSLIIISQAQSLAYFIAAAILVGLGEAVNQPILLSECVSSAAPSEHGRASNTNYIGIDIGNFIGSNLSGILVAVIGYRSMFLMAILPVLIATGFYLYIKRKQHGDRIGVKKQIGASESVCRRIREGESST